jgi:hypothetical protein
MPVSIEFKLGGEPLDSGPVIIFVPCHQLGHIIFFVVFLISLLSYMTHNVLNMSSISLYEMCRELDASPVRSNILSGILGGDFLSECHCIWEGMPYMWHTLVKGLIKLDILGSYTFPRLG